MSGGEIVLTTSSKRRIEEELQDLHAFIRPQAKEALRQVHDDGDPLDNGEYQRLCLNYAIMKGRIAVMEALLERATIVEENAAFAHTVASGPA